MPTIPKFCTTCTHYQPLPYQGGAPGICKFHPMSKPTAYMRDHKSLCGPDGRYHQEKR